MIREMIKSHELFVLPGLRDPNILVARVVASSKNKKILVKIPIFLGANISYL